MTVMLSGAVRGAAAKVKEKMCKIAAHLLEASLDDMEVREGRVWVKGTDRSLSLTDIGMKAYWNKFDLPAGMESGLEGSFTYDHPYTTLPSEDSICAWLRSSRTLPLSDSKCLTRSFSTDITEVSFRSASAVPFARASTLFASFS